MLSGNIDWNAIQSKIHLVLYHLFFFFFLVSLPPVLSLCALKKVADIKCKKMTVILVTAVGVFAEHSLLIYFPTIVYN